MKAVSAVSKSENDALNVEISDVAAPTLSTELTCHACGALNTPNSSFCETCGASFEMASVGQEGISPVLTPGTVIGEKYHIGHLLVAGDYNVYLASAGDEAFVVKEAFGSNGFDLEIQRLQCFAYPTLARFVETITQGDCEYLICTAPAEIQPLYTVEFEHWREVVRALLSLCQTLQKLHDANLLLNDFSSIQWNAVDGRVFIYELAHAIERQPSGEELCVSEPGETIWVDVNFSAPEAQRNDIDAIGVASEVFALAALFQELLTGVFYNPIDTELLEETAQHLITLPPGLLRLLSVCLQNELTERLSSIAEVKRELIQSLAIQSHAWAAKSDVGQHRSQNQDAYFVQFAQIYAQSESQAVGLYLVADGMGGGTAGDIASLIVVQACQEAWGRLLADDAIFQQSDEARTNWIRAILDEANREILALAGSKTMGSTATLCLVIQHMAYIAHIGDSRAYLVDDDGLHQLTDDHSLVAELVRHGQLTPEQAETHPQRHIIYKTLGTERVIEPDVFTRTFAGGQGLLLCSDGLCGTIGDEDIYMALSEVVGSHMDKVNALINLANHTGGPDNITVVYVTFE